MPRFTFEDTIGMTVTFEKRYAEGISAKNICENMIPEYFQSKSIRKA